MMICTSVEEVLEVEVDSVCALGDPVRFIHLHMVTVEKVCIGVLSYKVTDPVKRTWQEEVIGIDPRHEKTGGFARALVDGVALTLVRPRVPISKTVLIFFEYLDAAVGGSTVNDDVFEVGIQLVVDGEDSPLQEVGLVKGWGDDRDLRPRRVRLRGIRRVEPG